MSGKERLEHVLTQGREAPTRQDEYNQCDYRLPLLDFACVEVDHLGVPAGTGRQHVQYRVRERLLQGHRTLRRSREVELGLCRVLVRPDFHLAAFLLLE